MFMGVPTKWGLGFGFWGRSGARESRHDETSLWGDSESISEGHCAGMGVGMRELVTPFPRLQGTLLVHCRRYAHSDVLMVATKTF